MGFVRVANETMCRPIRALTQMKGYDVGQHTLACFGGAGGQHACAIAQNLGMRNIFVHRYAGVLSAVGISLADVVAEEQARSFLGASLSPFFPPFSFTQGEPCLAVLPESLLHARPLESLPAGARVHAPPWTPAPNQAVVNASRLRMMCRPQAALLWLHGTLREWCMMCRPL